tara:strand:+ start:6167 stop:8731 length:2565 start_codon:yes stop_codon:yes gene_type:complete
MIENSLIQSNFLGRDGFKWWVGQVAPEDAQGSQINGEGWGNRVKVRILGYHPADDVELPNKDLPWAHVLISPESGSGRAGRSKPIKISPGDTVLGFFLDGDVAQQPVILGVFTSSGPAAEESKDKQYSQPFVPFTGYTSKVKPNDNIAQSEASGQNKEGSPTNRQVDTETAKKIEEATGKAQKVASTVIGTTVTFGDTGGARSAVNKINGELKNAIKDYKNATPALKNKVLSNASKNLSNLATGMSASMVSSTFDGMAPKLNQGLHKLYKDKYGEVLSKTGNIALAKKAASSAQKAKVPSILNIENAIPCMMKNVTDKLQGNIADLLSPLLDNVQNFNDCIGDQFSAGILNSIIGSIDDALAPLMGDVSDIFPGDIAGMLRDKADGLFGLSEALGGCDLPTASSSLAQKTNQWTLGKGPKSLTVKSLEQLSGSLLSVANAAESLKEAAGGTGVLSNLLSGVTLGDIPGLPSLPVNLGAIGTLASSVGAFDFMSPLVNTPGYNSELGDCYTGTPLNCSGIKVNVFGGDGSGATAQAIIGALVGDNLAEQTGSLIGIKMTNNGSGYTTPPFVEIVDTCNQGYGGIAKAVIDYDKTSPTYSQVTDIIVVNGGENYPVIETNDENYTVDHVVIINPGENYKEEDIITDNQGNQYTKFIDESGRLLNVIPPNPETNNVEQVTELPELFITGPNGESTTGSGAILKAQISPRPSYQGEVKQVIDCITPRDGIVGFVNGEPYYGAFHVMPNGVKMTGVKHSDNDMIIYDTPQESRTTRAMMSTSTTVTTVSSPQVTYSPDEIVESPETTMVDTTEGSGTINYDTSTPSTPSSSPPPSSPPSSPPPSSPPSSPPSGGGYSGY